MHQESQGITYNTARRHDTLYYNKKNYIIMISLKILTWVHVLSEFVPKVNTMRIHVENNQNKCRSLFHLENI